MTREEALELVLDYVYGDLSPEVAALVREWADKDPEVRAEIETAVEVRRAASSIADAPDLPDHLRERILKAARARTAVGAGSGPAHWFERFLLSPAFSGAMVLVLALGVGIHLMIEYGSDMGIEQVQRVAARSEQIPEAMNRGLEPKSKSGVEPRLETGVESGLPEARPVVGTRSESTGTAAGTAGGKLAAQRPSPAAGRGGGGAATAPDTDRASRRHARVKKPARRKLKKEMEMEAGASHSRPGAVLRARSGVEAGIEGVGRLDDMDMGEASGRTAAAGPASGSGWVKPKHGEASAPRPKGKADHLALARRLRREGDLRGALSEYLRAVDSLTGDRLKQALNEAAEVAGELGDTRAEARLRARIRRFEAGKASPAAAPAGE